ncbi:smalltalk protein [uncultured Parabacteroides sp.]|nr:smalltalk protein [uncultured Parabacteroides sp.]
MSENNKKSVWKLIIQTIITILTAIGTSLGVTSCI